MSSEHHIDVTILFINLSLLQVQKVPSGSAKPGLADFTHLSEREEEALEPGEVPDQLEDPQDPHHPDQADDLAGLADDLDVFQLGKKKHYPMCVIT